MNSPLNQSITLCGSMTDTETVETIEILRDYFTLKGFIVYAPCTINEQMKDLLEMSDDECKTTVDSIQMQSIRLSDIVFIVNCGYRIDKDILDELTYAIALNKSIQFYTVNTRLQDLVNKVKGGR